ncbi:hypothetical protein [Brucella pituitosa]|uniref:hypothetical protein n=1 Tax=Brucella pituitosa TaxID=571256 RepID=UPI0009A181E2|nr:hypothetical protein [Brucella pituitosa]
MKPKTLMIMGAIYGAAAWLFSMMQPQAAESLCIIMSFSGALFGKGHGVWEERLDQRLSETLSAQQKGEAVSPGETAQK